MKIIISIYLVIIGALGFLQIGAALFFAFKGGLSVDNVSSAFAVIMLISGLFIEILTIYTGIRLKHLLAQKSILFILAIPLFMLAFMIWGLSNFSSLKLLFVIIQVLVCSGLIHLFRKTPTLPV